MLIIQNHQPATMPTNEYMRGIYQLVPGRIVHTPKGRRINRILEVGDDYVIIQSDAPHSRGPRRISFDDIRNPPDWTNWQIIQSLRQLVGLSNEA
jgi:hypothetical protein